MRSNIFAVMGTMMLGRILAEAIRLIYGPVPFTIENWLSGTIKIGTQMCIRDRSMQIILEALLDTVMEFFHI